MRNSLSNSPCPLGRARGRGLIYSARTSNKQQTFPMLYTSNMVCYTFPT